MHSVWKSIEPPSPRTPYENKETIAALENSMQPFDADIPCK